MSADVPPLRLHTGLGANATGERARVCPCEYVCLGYIHSDTGLEHQHVNIPRDLYLPRRNTHADVCRSNKRLQELNQSNSIV